MAGLEFATAGTPRERFSNLRRTNGMPFSEAYETENSTVSAGSDASYAYRCESARKKRAPGALFFVSGPRHLGQAGASSSRSMGARSVSSRSG